MAVEGFSAANFLDTLAEVWPGAEPFGLWVRLNHPDAGVSGQIYVLGQDAVSTDRRHLLLTSGNGIQCASVDAAGSAANISTVPGNEWAAAQCAWISSVLRSMWLEGTGRVDETTSRTPAAPDKTIIGLTTTDGAPFPGGLAEISVWDLTGFSTTDENDWAALGATTINPYIANRQAAQPWAGSLVAYWRLLTSSDIQDLSGAGFDLVLSGSLTTFATHPSVDNIILAAFSGGNGSAEIDQFPGVAGGGWVGGWLTLEGGAADFTATVVNTTPLEGGGNYLSTTNTALGTTGTSAKVAREYETLGNVDITQPHQMEFRLRLDALPASWTQISMFAREETLGNGGTNSSDTWEIASHNGGNWSVTDGGTLIDTGIALQTGVVYTFFLDLRQSDYQVRIAEDGVLAYSSPILTYRNGSTTGPLGFIQFATNPVSDPDTIETSLDSILIAETITTLTDPPVIGAGEGVSPNHARLTGLVESTDIPDEYQVWAAVFDEHPSAFDGEIIATLVNLASTEIVDGLSADQKYRIGIRAVRGVSEIFSNEVEVDTLQIAHFTLTNNDTITLSLDTEDDDAGVLESLNGVDVQFGKYEDDGAGTVGLQIQLENNSVIIYDQTFNDVGLIPTRILDLFEDVSPVVNPRMHITALIT